MRITRRSLFASALWIPALVAARPASFAAPQTAAPKALAVLDFAIAGGTFHALPAARPLLSVGEALALRREPDNGYDRFAVAVHRRDGTKLGYVPRQATQSLARLMDSGALISVEIVGFFDDGGNREAMDRALGATAFTSVMDGDPRLRATLLA